MDVSLEQQGPKAGRTTKPRPREHEAVVNAERLVTQDCSLRTVLLVGQDPEMSSTRLYLLNALNVTVTIATGYSEACSRPERSSYSVVAIGMRAGFEEARKMALHVRRSWPNAKILLLGESTLDLDDPLYDDIVDPAFNSAALVRSFLQLSKPADHRDIH